MRKLFIALALTSMLGGCMALPVPVQMASFALDGISMITTEKSLTDRGLSLVAGRDCAVWRGFTDDNICQETPADDDDAFTLSNANDTKNRDLNTPATKAFSPAPVVLETAMAASENPSQGFELPPGMARPVLLPHLEIM